MCLVGIICFAIHDLESVVLCDIDLANHLGMCSGLRRESPRSVLPM